MSHRTSRQPQFRARESPGPPCPTCAAAPAPPGRREAKEGETAPRALLVRGRQPPAGSPHRSPARCSPRARSAGQEARSPARTPREPSLLRGSAEPVPREPRTAAAPGAFPIAKCEATGTPPPPPPSHGRTVADSATGSSPRRPEQASLQATAFKLPLRHRSPGAAQRNPHTPPSLRRLPALSPKPRCPAPQLSAVPLPPTRGRARGNPWPRRHRGTRRRRRRFRTGAVRGAEH